ncbi:MAG: S41 family peptidase [Planctomycetota bacterium]
MRKEKYVFLFLFVTIACMVTAGLMRNGARGQEGDDAGEMTEKVITILEPDLVEPDQVWRTGRSLEALGAGAVPALLARWKELPPHKQVAAAWALSRLGRREEVLTWALSRIGEEKEVEVQVLLADLMRTSAVKADSSRLEALVDEIFEPRVKVPLCKALWETGNNLRGKKELKSLLRSEDEKVRIDAAVALAELGDVEPGKRVLRRLAEEPTPRGQLARSLLREYTLKRMLERAQFKNTPQGKNRFDDPILDEIRVKIGKFYVDPSKKEFPLLAAEAASGIAQNLDPFSSYVRMKTLERMGRILSGELVGVGITLSFDPKTGPGEEVRRVPVVVAPLLKGAASLAGVQAMDEIWEIDGESALGKTLIELEGMIAGEPGSMVTLKLYHKGWFRERTVTLRRGKTPVDDLLEEKLPGGILLLKLPRMSVEVGGKLQEILQGAKTSGTRGVILDLRNNASGPNRAALDVAGAFLPKSTTVYSVAGRNAEAFTAKSFVAASEGKTDLPLAILVNVGTAGSAEVLAGALRDAKRATLVGEKTFGAGSVQKQFPLEATDGKTALRLTVAYLQLPRTGRFHGVGLKPDRLVTMRPTEIWRHDEIYKIVEAGHVTRYVDEHFEKDRELFEELARRDHGKTDRYPGFKEWFLSTGTRAEEDDLRGLVRAEIRRRLSATPGTPYLADLQEDVQICEAVKVLAKPLGLDLKKIPEYAPFSGKD